MPRSTYSRLVVPRRAKDDSVLGLLSLSSPLGFEQQGEDLVACFRDAAAAREAGQALAVRRIRHRLVTDIPEEDPLEAYRALSRPFTVGRRFWIDPGDPSDSTPPGGRIALRLPASRAFGTGAHESTRLALLALEEEDLADEAVLDAGTGSGVLALAAAALGARSAVGYDTSSEAVFVAHDNVRRHSFGGRVALVAAPTEAIRGAFRVVIANLLPEELLPIRAQLAARVARGGHLILSGIPEEREDEVLAKLRWRRFSLEGRRRENGWVCVCLARG
jgi:ribosomal protein L11 methyltransferase